MVYQIFALGVGVGITAVFASISFALVGIFYKFKKNKYGNLAFKFAFLFIIVGITSIYISYSKFTGLSG